MSTQPSPIQSQSPKWAVQAPDGKVIQFPDEFTDKDVTREMTKMYPQTPESQAPDAIAQARKQVSDVITNRPNQRVAFQSSVPGIVGSQANVPPEVADAIDKQRFKTGLETAGGFAGGELAAPLAAGSRALPWLIRAAARNIPIGAGVGAGNAAGQGATTGTVDPKELAKAAAITAGTGMALEGAGQSLPWMRSLGSKLGYDSSGEVRPWAAATGKAIENPTALPGKAAKAIASKVFPPPPQYPGAPLPAADEFYANKAADLTRRGTQQATLDRQAATAARAAARNAPKPAAVAFAEAQSAEGVPGTLPKPSGRIIKLPQEFAAEDQLQGIAKTRASQRGMQFAAGMVPGEGRSVPRTPTATNTVEFPSRPVPWETQGATAPTAAPVATPQFKGGINQKGVEASNVQMSPEDTMTSLSTEIGRMNTRLRNSAGSSAVERADLQNQINEYQQRLNELRGPVQRLPWAKN